MCFMNNLHLYLQWTTEEIFYCSSVGQKVTLYNVRANMLKEER